MLIIRAFFKQLVTLFRFKREANYQGFRNETLVKNDENPFEKISCYTRVTLFR